MAPREEDPAKTIVTMDIEEKIENTEKEQQHLEHDPALDFVWFWEERPTTKGDVLTTQALDRIAAYKYPGGSKTTFNKMVCDPFWTAFTEILPMALTPNRITIIGSLHCLVSYLWTWYAAPVGNEAVPAWLLVANAYCLFMAYTLDGMDGKQARRTQTGSPLGHVLDHGLDCLCVMADLIAIQAWLRAVDILPAQTAIQFCFFMSRWQEYYTRVIPHTAGEFSAAEVKYGLAVISLLHGTLFYYANNNAVVSMYDAPVVNDLDWLLSSSQNDNNSIFIPTSVILLLFGNDDYKTVLADWRRQDVIVTAFMATGLFIASLLARNVWCHNNNSGRQQPHRLHAALHLVVPAFLTWLTVANHLHPETFQGNATAILATMRWKSFTVGILYCHLSIKTLVYSTGRQAMAVIQWDCLPYIVAAAWTVMDATLDGAAHGMIWKVTAAYYVWRLFSWNKTVLRQMSERMNVSLWAMDPVLVETSTRKRTT